MLEKGTPTLAGEKKYDNTWYVYVWYFPRTTYSILWWCGKNSIPPYLHWFPCYWNIPTWGALIIWDRPGMNSMACQWVGCFLLMAPTKHMFYYFISDIDPTTNAFITQTFNALFTSPQSKWWGLVIGWSLCCTVASHCAVHCEAFLLATALLRVSPPCSTWRLSPVLVSMATRDQWLLLNGVWSIIVEYLSG